MRDRSIRVAIIAIALVTISACDDLTEKSEDVTVTLDSFNLVGNNGNAFSRATVTGNPACTASMTSLNSLLAQTDNFDDIKDKLESLDINQIQYRITANRTPVEASGLMQMTSPDTGQLTPVASVSIPANGVVSDWTLFPFSENGASVVQHYMDNLDANFLYCAEGRPNSSELSMTIELRLNMTVTVDLL